jgi:hypothetical protein
LTLVDTTDPAKPQAFVVAEAQSFSCGELVVGTFLPRSGGGAWLVSDSGCYVGMDASFQRTDPLELTEHLRRRGSIGMGWDEPEHLYYLGWVLFGLPLCLVLGLLLFWLRRKSAGRTLAWAAGFFLVSGAWLLMKVWPLLR